MRLDFNILWIDDQPERVRSYQDAISRKIRKHGFQIQIAPATSASEAKEKLKGSNFADEIDLILVDFDLGAHGKGDTILNSIRHEFEFRDIVFYSAEATQRLRELAFKRKVDGIYCCTRDDVVDEVVGLFESLMNRVLDLDHLRGIVMGATSDIDHVIYESLSVLITKLEKSGNGSKLRKKLEAKFDEKRKNLEKTENIAKAKDLVEACRAHGVVTANDRLRLLVNALDLTEFTKHKTGVQDYLRDVVPLRNTLGHVRMAVDKNGVRKLAELSEGELRAVLPMLLDHRSKFYQLARELSPSE